MIDSFASSPTWEAVSHRRYGLLVASRFPLTPASSTHAVHWPERLLSAEVAMPNSPVTIHTTHIPPGSSNGWNKIKMLESVLGLVATPSAGPRLLCGDFNVPKLELPDGRVVTAAEHVADGLEPRLRIRFRGDDGRRWDLVERTLMQGGAGRELIDAYRFLHGYGREEFSWYLKRGPLRSGRRFDHVFCSPDLKIVRCEYLHEMRVQGLSDHSALELDFEV
jgi:exonuclease III